jgi:hypothetical protein
MVLASFDLAAVGSVAAGTELWQYGASDEFEGTTPTQAWHLYLKYRYCIAIP